MTSALSILFFASGWSALTCQVVWTRWLGLALGTFAGANATVVATFMAGLALGYRLLGGVAARRDPSAALRLYARLAAGIAAFAFVSPWLLGPASPLAGPLAGLSASPLPRAAACALLLLPPTILMGGTLPVMLAADAGHPPGALARLYAVNTLGGAAGPLTAGFALIPALGLSATARTAAAAEAAVAIAAFAYSRRLAGNANGPAFAPSPGIPPAPAAAPPLLAGLLAFSGGALSLAFEIVLVHLVILTVTGGSIYALSLTLAAYLGGLGIGAGIVARWPPRSPRAALLAAAAALVLPWVFSLTRPFWGEASRVPLALWTLGIPFAGAKAGEFAFALVALLPVSAAFGAALPALAIAARAEADPGAAGNLFAANSAGAVLGAPVAGFLLLPVAGVDLALAVLGGLALVVAAVTAAAAAPRLRYAFAGLACLAVVPAILPAADPVMLNIGMHYRPDRFAREKALATPETRGARAILYEHSGLLGHVAVRAAEGQKSLVVNGKPDSSNSIVDATTMVLNGAIPLLLHPAPRRVLIIGLGAGITAGVALRPPDTRVTCVEIDPGVVGAARLFDDLTGAPLDNPRFRLLIDDGRHFLRVAPGPWDVVISMPSNLYVAGSVNLFTAEFVRLVRSRLAPDGLFCLWLHYYGVSLDDCRTVIRTVASVFPELTVWINRTGADVFIVSGNAPQVVPWDRWQRLFASAGDSIDVQRIGIRSPAALAALYQFGSADARAFAGPGPLCTDDRPLLEFTAPLTPNTAASLLANCNAFDNAPVADPVPLVHANRRDRLAIARIARSLGRGPRADLEERTARGK